MRAVETIKNIWKIEDLRNRILTTLLLVAIYRFGTYVVLPGIDPKALTALQEQTRGGLLALLDMFSGGAFSNASIFALGIMPYISASIVIHKLLNTIKIIKSKLNPALEIEGFLLTMYDSRLRLANQIYEEVKRPFRDLVFTTVIQRNVKLSEASSYGKPVLLYDADSKGSINHMQLAQEIVEKNKGLWQH